VLSDISPLGLGLKVEAFYRNDMAPVLIIVAEGVLLSVIALAICSVRDYGAGIIPARKGRANASRFLCSPLGFAWRVSTGTALGWGAGLFLLGASFGSVCADINSFVENNDMMRNIIGAGGGNALLDGYVAMIFALLSIAVSVPAVLTVMKIRSEEKQGRLDQIFGRAVPRLKLYGAFIVVAIMESVVMEFLLAAGLVAAAGGELALPALLKAGFSYLPATWVMTGVAVLLVGAVPKLSALVWAALGYSFIALYMGRVMDVPELIVKITPFGSIPQLPVQEFMAIPLIVLTVTAAALAALGLWRFQERDIG
jgi:ABC-2 type transport system permease protein